MGKDDKPDFFDSCSEYEPTDDETSSSCLESEQETSSEEGNLTPTKRQLPDEELGDDTEEEEYDEEPSVSNIIKLLDLAAGDAIRQREIPVSFCPPYHVSKKIKIEREKVDNLLRNSDEGSLSLSDRVLNSNLPLNVKAILIRKIEDPNLCSSDKSKVLTWATTVMSLPLGTITPLPVSNKSSQKDINAFLVNARKILDDTVYGMNSTKEELLDFLTKFITNPDSRGTVLGLHGEKGLGKSRICLALSKILSLPFFQISCGGLTDASVLLGHDSTYVGSKCGRIAQNLKKCAAMNPIICFDEIDKLGNESGKAGEVYGVLTHLLDETQNHIFQDLYLDEVTLDLSKALFVATFNDKTKIDPIVLNRIKVVNVSPLMMNEKINIVKKFIIPEFNTSNNLQIAIKDSLIEYIISRKTETESGMRNIRKNFETLFSRINTIKVLETCENSKEIHKDFSYTGISIAYDESNAIVITKNMVDSIIKTNTEDKTWMSMYV